MAWLWHRVKKAVALVLIGTAGATPAWAVDRWVVPLDPLVYLALSITAIVGILKWTNYGGIWSRNSDVEIH